MRPETERRLLQVAITLGCLSPLCFGALGVIAGPAMVGAAHSPPDLVSHYRYLSGLFLGLGLILLSCVPRIETRTARLRWTCGAIMVGGLARALGLAWGDAPSATHKLALAAELGLVPLLLLWQARVARYCAEATRVR